MTEVSAELLHGTLHIFVAFDWGNEVNLEHAGRLAPGALLTFARRPRTPVSVAFQPTPWRFRLAAVPVEIPELGRVEAEAEATVFDFGAVALASDCRLRFRDQYQPAGGIALRLWLDRASCSDRRCRIV